MQAEERYGQGGFVCEQSPCNPAHSFVSDLYLILSQMLGTGNIKLYIKTTRLPKLHIMERLVSKESVSLKSAHG